MKRSLPVCAALLLGGCAAPRASCPPLAACPPDAAAYAVGCPDVLEVRFATRPEWDAAAAVDLDGRLPLGPAGRPAVAGCTPDEARAAVAAAAKVPPDAVSVSVAEHRAARVYLSGPLNEHQAAVPYLGPERVSAFLLRAGAARRGTTDPRDVKVIRPNVAAGGAPREFDVDLREPATDVLLEPSDEVVVGETRRSEFSRVVPKWLLPAYRAFWGVE